MLAIWKASKTAPVLVRKSRQRQGAAQQTPAGRRASRHRTRPSGRDAPLDIYDLFPAIGQIRGAWLSLF